MLFCINISELKRTLVKVLKCHLYIYLHLYAYIYIYTHTKQYILAFIFALPKSFFRKYFLLTLQSFKEAAKMYCMLS